DRQDYLLEDIDRIEVISGPGGTLWGANAVNGVINIITRSAQDSQGLYVEAGGGSRLNGVGGLRYGGKMGASGAFRVYGRYFDRGNELFPSGRAAADAWRKGQGGFRMDFQRSPRDAFTLQGDLYDGDQGLSTGGSARVEGGNVLGRWSRDLSNGS